jgi:transcription initiation factor TFIIIB Brf1 subunit/transcription initiation factor TFIIB
MPDTVTITELQGARYTWATASFTWASASAGKSWTTAYPAVYSIAVAVTLALTEATGRQWTKRSNESLLVAENLKRQFMLCESETFGFSETYSDLIAFVLRFVESLAMTEGVSKASRKAAKEAFQSADYLSRTVIKRAAEGIVLADVLRQSGIKRIAEQLPITESSGRVIGKANSEALGLGDDFDRLVTKRIAEGLSFAETYADLIAFVLRISENLGLSDLGAKQVRKPVSEAFGTSDKAARQSIKRVAEAVAMGEAIGRTVAYRRLINEGLGVSDALKRALRINASEALLLAEQYRRHANGVISDMIISTTEITEQDFANILGAGHPPGYTDFRDFIQGDYTYRRALFRAILNSRNSDRGFIDALRVTVDVPDIFDRGTAQITDPAVGSVIGFTRSFRVPPEVTVTHKGGTAVAIPRLIGSITTTGFTAVLENTSAARVTGSFTWIAQGY